MTCFVLQTSCLELFFHARWNCALLSVIIMQHEVGSGRLPTHSIMMTTYSSLHILLSTCITSLSLRGKDTSGDVCSAAHFLMETQPNRSEHVWKDLSAAVKSSIKWKLPPPPPPICIPCALVGNILPARRSARSTQICSPARRRKLPTQRQWSPALRPWIFAQRTPASSVIPAERRGSFSPLTLCWRRSFHHCAPDGVTEPWFLQRPAQGLESYSASWSTSVNFKSPLLLFFGG